MAIKIMLHKAKYLADNRHDYLEGFHSLHFFLNSMAIKIMPHKAKYLVDNRHDYLEGFHSLHFFS
jgi:hypothetical protein